MKAICLFLVLVCYFLLFLVAVSCGWLRKVVFDYRVFRLVKVKGQLFFWSMQSNPFFKIAIFIKLKFLTVGNVQHLRSGSIVRSSITASRAVDPGSNPGRSTIFILTQTRFVRVLPSLSIKRRWRIL